MARGPLRVIRVGLVICAACPIHTRLCCKTRSCLSTIVGLEFGLPAYPLPRHRHGLVTQLLHWASSCRRWWGTPEQLDEPLQILRSCGEQYLISRPAQTSQPKPVKPQDALHMCKPHLYLLALAA